MRNSRTRCNDLSKSSWRSANARRRRSEMLHTTVLSKPRKFSTILFRVAQVPVTAGNVRRFLPEATGTAEPTPSQFSSLKNDRRPGSGGADWPVTRRAVFRRDELLIPHLSARLRFELPPRSGLRSGQRSCAPAPRRRAALSEVRDEPAGPALPVTVACPPGRSGRARPELRLGARGAGRSGRPGRLVSALPPCKDQVGTSVGVTI